MNLFSAPKDRAQAMGVFGFVAAGGGSIGVLLGGLLTAVNWHWIFLVNIPIGIVVFLASLYVLPPTQMKKGERHLDVWGAAAVTGALIIANYAIVGGNAAGWLSGQTLGLLALAVAVFLIFLRIESRVRSPLMPLSMFALRNVAVANVVGVLWAAAMFAWFFISALYMQLVLRYTPLQVGLSFLPANLIMAVFFPRTLRAAGHALRHQDTARRRARGRRARLGPFCPRAGRRAFSHRPLAEHALTRRRCGHGVQSRLTRPR